jgi:LysM repeat protein
MVVSRPADPAAAPTHIDRPANVTVAAGETMADIARKWHTSVAAIMMENDLVQDTVTKGQKLKLPRN